MKKYINYIQEKIGSGLKGTILTFENMVSFFIMNKSASNDEIAKCDLHFNRKLSGEYKFFLHNFNGGILFKINDYAGFKFLSIDELIKHNEFQKENFGEDWDPEIILFCECLGDAEYLGFKLNKIVYCVMDMLPQEWEIIENSFDTFISKLIEENGRKYWLAS
jgi:hypothetical protein